MSRQSPQPPASSPQLPARYVLLRHECPPGYRDGPHWDLMLEDGDTLRTWSLLELPSAWSGIEAGPHAVAATSLPAHRKVYLDYEGEVSNGRGSVTRVAEGKFRWLIDSDQIVEIDAASGMLRGRWRIKRIEGNEWRLET